MKIYLVDKDEAMCSNWAYYFQDFMEENVIEVFQYNVFDFLKENKVDAIVSPANSFGRMDGGYDWFLSEYYRTIYNVDITAKVRDQLAREYRGEQPVGTAMTVFVQDAPALIHAPTMRYPKPIEDGEVIINCMRLAINECAKNGLEKIVIPAFGGGIGKVPFWQVALLMRIGLINYAKPIDSSSWDEIYNRIKDELAYKEALEDEANE